MNNLSGYDDYDLRICCEEAYPYNPAIELEPIPAETGNKADAY